MKITVYPFDNHHSRRKAIAALIITIRAIAMALRPKRTQTLGLVPPCAEHIVQLGSGLLI